MTLLTLYTPQNGDFFKEALDAMVTLLGTATFQSAIDIVLILAVCMTSYQYIQGKKLQALVRYVLTSFFALVCLIGVKVNVAIIDMQDNDSAGKALTVDNVPLGVALPGALISGLGYGLSRAFAFVFHMPNDLDYNKTGLIFGARTWRTATAAGLSMSPDLALDMSTYIRQCIFAAKLLGSQKISPQALKGSTDLISLYFKDPSPLYRVILQNGDNLSCQEAASILKKRLTPAANEEITRLSKLMVHGNEGRFGNSLAAAHNYYMAISKDSASLLTQNILINATRDAASDAFAFNGADAQLMNYTNTASLHKMHLAETNSFWLASYRLPYYMTVMWMLTICIFPLVFLVTLLPTLQNVFTVYLQSQVFLWSWPPMFIIIHFFVSLGASKTMSVFGGKTGGVSFSNIDTLATLSSGFAYTAGALAASVPVIAYYITKGLPSVLSTASQHLGGMAQSLSVGEAQAIAQGNVSMASYSGWNMNYNNTSANKFDSNYYHSEGQATVQTANGALLTETSSGARIGNALPAISHAAVGVNLSDRVVDSLHQSANESFNQASLLRTAADSHLQAGLSEMKQFASNDANEYRSGEGLSDSVNDSYGADLRRMKDLVSHYNKHHDSSGQVSAELAIAGKINSEQALLGKFMKLVWGGSIEGSATGRASVGLHSSTQEFNNSSEGKAFNETFNHLVSTARNNHLDAADSLHLSKSEQIAANFAKGLSLSDQASSEYSHGQQLQKAASRASDHAQSIDMNLNQPYHDWVVSHHGARGEQVMLQTDAASIQTQQVWAEEFLSSREGQAAVSAQVHSALATTKEDLRENHEREAQALHDKSLQKVFHGYTEEVDKKADREGFVLMSDEQLNQAAQSLENNRKKDITNEAESVKIKVENNANTKAVSNREFDDGLSKTKGRLKE
ncbi:TPA: conjugal transfer protein TraG N-terminal domain-containing protein [Legionella feeleii]